MQLLLKTITYHLRRRGSDRPAKRPSSARVRGGSRGIQAADGGCVRELSEGKFSDNEYRLRMTDEFCQPLCWMNFGGNRRPRRGECARRYIMVHIEIVVNGCVLLFIISFDCW